MSALKPFVVVSTRKSGADVGAPWQEIGRTETVVSSVYLV